MYVCSQYLEQAWATITVRFLLVNIGTVTRGNLLTISDNYNIQLNAFKKYLFVSDIHTSRAKLIDKKKCHSNSRETYNMLF